MLKAYIILLLSLTFTSFSQQLLADQIDAWFAIDRFLEINTRLALEEYSKLPKSYPQGKATLLAPHQLTSEYSMIQSVLEENFEQGDIYSGQVLAWLCKKDIVELDEKVCRRTNSEIFPLHRIYGNQIQESLDAYFGYFEVPIKGQIFEVGSQKIRVVSVTKEANGKRVSNSLKKQERKRQKNLDKLIQFSENGNPFAQLLLGNIAWETSESLSENSKNLANVEELYRLSATHPFPLGMKAHRRFCTAHREYCQNERTNKKIGSELRLLEQDAKGNLLIEEYHNPSSELYRLYPEDLQRYQNQWIIYQNLYGKGIFYHIVDLYLGNMIHSAGNWNEIERKAEAARWVNHGVNFQIGDFAEFEAVSNNWETSRQVGPYKDLDIESINKFYTELLFGRNSDILSGKAKIYIASYITKKTIQLDPSSTEITWLSQLKFQILSELNHLSDIDKTMILNQLGRALELDQQDYLNAQAVYLKAHKYAESARAESLQEQPDLAEELKRIKLTNGYNIVNAAILANNMSASTRQILEDTLIGGEEDIKNLFTYFVVNTNRREDVLWAIDILNSGRISELSIPKLEQILWRIYFSESLLTKFENEEESNFEEENDDQNSVNSTEPQKLSLINLQAIDYGDLSGFQDVEARKKTCSPKINLEDPTKFAEFIRQRTAHIRDYKEISFNGINSLMSGSLLELATQDHFGRVRNFVVALDDNKIRDYNIPSTGLLKYKGTPSLEFDGAFWDSNRDEIFWYDVKSIDYSNESIDFENIVEGLKRHKVAASMYGASFLFISKDPVPRPVASLLKDAGIEWITIF